DGVPLAPLLVLGAGGAEEALDVRRFAGRAGGGDRLRELVPCRLVLRLVLKAAEGHANRLNAHRLSGLAVHADTRAARRATTRSPCTPLPRPPLQPARRLESAARTSSRLEPQATH